MDMLGDEEDNEPITKLFSSSKRPNNLQDEQDQNRKRYRFDEYDRIPARRG